MPTERLVEDIVDVPALLFPETRNPTGLQRDRTPPPDILNTHACDLLRVKIEHMRKGRSVFPLPAHIAETVQSPTSPASSAVGERARLVEVHQQWRTLKGVEVDIN